MAERRMFAKTIIDSDAFLDMPLSTQALYFHLSMRADDEGFINNPKKIQRMIGASDDDLKILIAKNFIIPFETGIVVIKHWRIHNYIRGDRKKETVYHEEMLLLETKGNGAYTLRESLPVVECNGDETLRQKAYKESTLPYSFEYKIRDAFIGYTCPVCGAVMKEDIDDGIITRNRIPTIQHNIPISKGGKHELGNISVICKQCNITLQDTETDSLNADEVIKKWDEITMTDKCQASGRQVAGSRHTQVRLGKDSIGKDSIDIYNTISTEPASCSGSEAPVPVFIELPLNDKTMHKVSKNDVEEYKELYPAVDVEQQLRNMKGWLDANPSRRKTKTGIKRFIASWLSKEQDKGGSKNGTNQQNAQGNDGEPERVLGILI